MELDEALSQIAEIRQQMAAAQLFRGYRAATAAFSGVVAIGAAAVQAWWLPDPAAELTRYLVLWLSAAALSLGLFIVELLTRYRRSATELQREMTLLAADQFLPSMVAGALLTAAVARFAQASSWMLPGLWGIIFGLGVFASRRLLPAAIFWVGAWYLAMATVDLALGQGARALAPWTMGALFGVGQCLAAVVLYWNLERGEKPER